MKTFMRFSESLIICKVTQVHLCVLFVLKLPIQSTVLRQLRGLEDIWQQARTAHLCQWWIVSIAAPSGTRHGLERCWEISAHQPFPSSNVVHFCEPEEHTLGLSLTALDHKLQPAALHLSAMICPNDCSGDDLDARGGMCHNWCEFLCCRRIVFSS